MRTKTLVVLTIIATATAVFGFMPIDTITMKGSDTMVILAQRWAEVFQGKNGSVRVQVTGGGSGTGISALINGTADICNSSRPMKSSERDQLKARYGSTGVEVRVARDGITIYSHPSNGVRQLSMGQLKGIFTGTITNWNQVGGPNARIILYGRENSSGTYGFFKEHVLKNLDFAASCQTLPGTAAIVNAVIKDRNGIGYGGFGYTKGVHVIAVSNADGGTAVLPSNATVKNGTYPISRFLYCYLRNRPTGSVKTFIDWILSSEGQAIVARVGYFPLN